MASLSQEAAAGSIDVQVRWWPFFLDRTLPVPGHDKMEHYNRKFGADRVRQMIPMMKRTAAAHGIDMNYGGKVGNTMDSHRLISFAQKSGRQDDMVNALFRRYFEANEDISDRSILAAAAEEAGVDGAAAYLESGEGEAEVNADVRRMAESNDIHGVPYFIIDNKFAVSGAQEAPALAQLITRAASNL